MATTAASSSIGSTAVRLGRYRVLKKGTQQLPQTNSKVGPVVYWMFRDQRLRDNWALIHAVDQANKLNVPVAVAFNLFDQFLGAKARQIGFMLRGLQQLHHEIEHSLQIPFFLFQGEAIDTIPSFLKECDASLLVTDFSPLRQVRGWKQEIVKRVSDSVTIHEVDAHNIVPMWVTSDKLEEFARTIRPKIYDKFPDYLTEFPTLKPQIRKWAGPNQTIDWEKLIENVVREGAEVPEIKWCEPGENAALETLMGTKNGFLSSRLKNYAADRNDPFKPKATSGLSPYLHFGQISAQRCAIEARKLHSLYPKAVDKFLDELIVWRELADNFCYYEPHYDSLLGAWDWARTTLANHAFDKREHIYTSEQLEKAQTVDPLWNASQLEMVHYGKMHGYMRMYWAKKILEWTSSPQEALEIAIYLNDKYSVDGRDPNGYAGIMWSICGVHDHGFQERQVFGKIRTMTYAGCTRKFNVDGYIAYVKKLVREIKKQQGEGFLNSKAIQPEIPKLL
ncbi:deoxyribodipyrimidine photo-lyase-like [Rutidosis leptorrhynchoides]|uniref:deoxyribodipyrimidine photo-lyase-like n=1 Tax=Rutidosis leptorrhynchoides TaxID=125765 RepID=UPI003A994C3F